ncbi:MAG: SIS domain-containing protein, partial [Clostridia bacterium]|nr:SIS domain-containing protein [Clostridia bacterium]
MTNLLERYPVLTACREDIKEAVNLMLNAYQSSGTILLCGNGGSAADCSHIAGELLKGFMSKRMLSDEDKKGFGEREDIAQKLQNGIPAISIPDQTAVLTAFCNDVDPALMYAQLVWAYGKKEDVLLCISTSGNAENVYNAAI